MTHINIFVNAISGLPQKTIAFAVPWSTSVSQLWESLYERAPILANTRVIATTNSNKQLPLASTLPVSAYLSSPQDDFLPLRLSLPLCGGKGGFGSQLRAAGGRMSSRKKRNQGDENASSRNLDGRRLRTVTEAKALAEYLSMKPDMEKKEKEKRRRRWGEIVEMADQRQADLRKDKGKLDGKWVEEKEEASERTREAVLAVMRSGMAYNDNLLGTLGTWAGSATSGEGEVRDEEEEGEEVEDEVLDEADSSENASSSSQSKTTIVNPRRFLGFDEDDEFMSSDSE